MTQTAELTASDGRGSADLGFCLAISGNTIVEGAPRRGISQGSGVPVREARGRLGRATQTADCARPARQQTIALASPLESAERRFRLARRCHVAANEGQARHTSSWNRQVAGKHTSHADDSLRPTARQ